MSCDVFEEAERRSAFADNAGDVRPEMPWVFVAELPTGNAERLARIATMDDIHRAAPRLAVEGGNIVPDRRAIQGRVFHPRHEGGRSVGVPLDVTHSAVPGDGEMEAEIKPSGSSAEGKSEQASPATICVNACGGR